MFAKKKFPKAIKYYSKAISIEPGNAVFRLNRAVANGQLELWKDAEEDAAKAIELADAPSSKNHFHLARAQLRRGRPEDALASTRRGLEAFPSDAALAKLEKEAEAARQKLEARRKAEEEEATRRAAPVQGPSALRSLYAEGRAAYEQGRVEDAARLLQEAREAAAKVEVRGDDLRRDEMGVLALLGKVFMRLRRHEEAVGAFEALLELEKVAFSRESLSDRLHLSNSLNNLGIAYKNCGRMKEAVDSLKLAYLKATNGDDQVATTQASQILQNVGQCLRAGKNPGEALKFYSRALEVDKRILGEKHSSYALNLLCIGRCHRDEGRLLEAIQSYTDAIELWKQKGVEECLAEMPELPGKERLMQLQNQARGELAQILSAVEQARGSASASAAA